MWPVPVSSPIPSAWPKGILAGSDVAICAVIAFPHRQQYQRIKLQEAEAAVEAGATEIDMVVNIGKVLGGEWEYVSGEIKAINAGGKHGCHPEGHFRERFPGRSAYHPRCAKSRSQHAVAFVKTSTGYGFVQAAEWLLRLRGGHRPRPAPDAPHTAPAVQIKAPAACVPWTICCGCVPWV